MKYADLHLHSTASDGNWSPEEVVKAARERGFSCIALTDHDTVGGISEALQAGEKHGVKILPALEFSTLYNGGEVHVLGYCIDWSNNELNIELEKVAGERLNRGRKMVDKLREMGVDVTWEEVKDIAAGGSVGRPHVARALVDKGYIDSIGEAFTEEYIGNGGRAYVKRYEMTPERAIQLTLDAGGIPVLAHPGFFKKDKFLDRQDVEHMVKLGIKGIEVWHTEHTEKDSRYYESLGKDFNLLLTGGSDCHGGNKDEILIGEVKLPYEYVERLLNAVQEK